MANGHRRVSDRYNNHYMRSQRADHKREHIKAIALFTFFLLLFIV